MDAMPEDRLPVTVRGLYSQDTAAVEALIAQTPGSFNVSMFREWVSNLFGVGGGPHTRVFVAEGNDQTLHGYIAYEVQRIAGAKRFHMHDCFVREDDRRHGVGTKLLYGMISGGPMHMIRLKFADVLSRLETPNAMPKWITTETFIADGNEPALRFLTKRGFKNAGNTEDNKIRLVFNGDRDE